MGVKKNKKGKLNGKSIFWIRNNGKKTKSYSTSGEWKNKLNTKNTKLIGRKLNP